MHRVMRDMQGPFNTIILEMLGRPMSRDDIGGFIERLGRRLPGRHHRGFDKFDLDADIARAMKLGVIEQREGMYELTPGGREMAEHMEEMIPRFIGLMISPRTVSIITVALYAVVSVLKLLFGFIAHSAGLIADGIDSAVDTASSVLVWLGITYRREHAASVLVIVLMYASLAGIGVASVRKIIDPGPIERGLQAFFITAICGVVMLLLSMYQYLASRRNGNFPIMCQAVDSRNHFLISLLVCTGIVLSAVAERTGAAWLYYADAAASILIGVLILKSAVELTGALLQYGAGTADVSHFMGRAQERMRAVVVRGWLTEQLAEGPLDRARLVALFMREFCRDEPRIIMLSGVGFRATGIGDLDRYLARLVRDGVIEEREGMYGMRTQ